MNRAERIREQLGMPQGTANGRLRKNLLFKYVVLVGHNVCYKCQKPIESVDDLSIEHKLPWENRDPELFWDLDNITFSHLRCNQPHQRTIVDWNLRGGHPNRRCSLDTNWCTDCKTCLPNESFTSNKRNSTKLEKRCVSCRSIYRKEKYRERSYCADRRD